MADIQRVRRSIWIGCAAGFAHDAGDLVYGVVPRHGRRNSDGNRNISCGSPTQDRPPQAIADLATGRPSAHEIGA
jgi:hypothetical protein